jgi:predicted permease
MPASVDRFLRQPHLWLIGFIGLIVPRHLRADWRQEWESELRTREAMLAEWEKLDRRHKLELFRRRAGAFLDALWLQPRRWEDEMIQDLRYGFRMLAKHPGVTVAIVLMLALGIGANAALFSMVNGVLLNPLPFPHPEQLMTLHQSKPNFATGAIPYPNFLDWRRENRTFSAMAVSRGSSFSLLGVGEAEHVDGRWVSADLFSVLGVEPALGRTFSSGEDERGAAPVVVISAGLWQRKFGEAADTVGKSLTLDDKSYTIVGVLPPSFGLYPSTDVYVPIGQWNNPALESRFAALGLHGIGRLRPGVTAAEAEADLDGVMQRLAEAYPDANRGNGATIVPMKELLVGNVRLTLWMLMGAVGFVLLIACVNVSNLLLARSTGRRREFAIRAAVGAGRWRLVRQLMIESMLLACLGGGLGLLLAWWGTRAALGVLPTALPRAGEIELDGRVLLFTASVTLLTGMLAGLAPALRASAERLSEAIKEGARGAAGGRLRAQRILVTVEVALALVLLVGAGLMIRSLGALWRVDPGFRAENVVTFGLDFSPEMQAATPEAARASLRELSDEIGAVPGVRAASFSVGASPLQSEDDLFFWIDGQPKPESTSEMKMALVYRVEPAYLVAMGIPLERGRFFTPADDERSRPVVVVDETFAEQYFPGSDPIGKRVNLGDDRGACEIVGVVGHVTQWNMNRNTDGQQSLQAQLYEPLWQSDGAPSGVGVVVRTDGEGSAALDSIRHVVRDHDSRNVVFGAQTMTQVMEDSLAPHHFSMILLEAFAAVALLLASVGLYGVVSHLVGQRTDELGIRLALGAGRSDVLRLVLGQGLRMAAGGVVLGLVAALALTRLLGNMLYGVSPTDPATFALIAALLVVVALLACWIPARRAMAVDPMTALRRS